MTCIPVFLVKFLFSISQVCRVAYEIMQTLHGDASESFRSLDDVFYYGGQNAHDLLVLEDHKANREGMIDIKVRDISCVKSNFNFFEIGGIILNRVVSWRPSQQRYFEK